MKRGPGVGMKRESMIEPVLEKPLLGLHAAMDVGSFWKATQRLLCAAIPNRAIGLALQQRPILPMIVRWTSPMPDGFFTAALLENYIAGRPRHRFVRVSGLFPNRSSLIKSAFYRRYMAPQRSAHVMCIFFWKNRRRICVIAIMRTATQGDLSPAERKLLRQLYPQFQTALCRLGTLEREHSARMDFEEFLSRLPTPTIILRWNLKPVYQNPAAREFCALWEKGPEEAKRTKATSPIPSEILDGCRILKERWTNAQPKLRSGPRRELKEEEVHHPRLPHLRATIHLKQLKSACMARPRFVIKCEDVCRNGDQSERLVKSHLRACVRLTRREREVAQLACEGRSNKEIACEVHLSVPMVKKHLHAVFRKLEVPSRSRLAALML